MFKDQREVDRYHGICPECGPTGCDCRKPLGYREQPSPAVTREQVQWLRTLVGAFAELRYNSPKPDQDPAATAEMISEVERLADTLDMHLDLQDKPADLPSPEEVEAMAKAAGLDNIPF